MAPSTRRTRAPAAPAGVAGGNVGPRRTRASAKLADASPIRPGLEFARKRKPTKGKAKKPAKPEAAPNGAASESDKDPGSVSPSNGAASESDKNPGSVSPPNGAASESNKDPGSMPPPAVPPPNGAASESHKNPGSMPPPAVPPPAVPPPAEEEEDRETALELLRLADQKREQALPLAQIYVSPVQALPVEATPVDTPPRPSTPTAPAAGNTSPVATAETPSGFFGHVWSAMKSWTTTKPKRPAAPTPIASPVVGEITMALTPTPTPVGHSRGNTKIKRSTGRRERANLAKQVASSVQDPAERDAALQWAEKILSQLLEDTASAGETRKRLEDGIQYGDLNHVNNKPWKIATGSFSLDDQLLDLVEDTPDDPAPMWAVLEHLRLELESPSPPSKKQKTAQDAGQDVTITPLNETLFPSTSLDNSDSPSMDLDQDDSPSKPSRKRDSSSMSSMLRRKRNSQPDTPSQSNTPSKSLGLSKTPSKSPNQTAMPFFNSGGKSVSLRDLRPRSCLLPQVQPKEDTNVFKKSHSSSRPQQNNSAGFSGSFTVPDDSDSDDDDDLYDAPATNTWTQPPPPAPVMPHAELPTSAGPTPSVPSLRGNIYASPTVDRLEAQRAKALKFTPLKPSNLSHMSKPSPSLRSDAGSESMVDSPAPSNLHNASTSNGASVFQTPGTVNGASIFQDTTSTPTPSMFQRTSASSTAPSFSQSATGGSFSLFQNPSTGTSTPSIIQSAGAGISSASPFQGASTGTTTQSFFKTAGTGIGSASPFQGANTHTATPSSSIPGAIPLDLPSDIMAAWEAYVQSDQFRTNVNTLLQTWSDPILEYDTEL